MGSLPHIVEDCMGVLQLFSDGTVFRSEDINFPFPIIEDTLIEFKDLVYDHKHNLHLRLYKPNMTTSINPNKKPLPIVIFIRGGGFCVGSRSWPNSHNCCLRLASGIDTVVISPDYRLAPENRLPAAMEDAISAMEWLQRQALGESTSDCDAWLTGRTVDFGRVFIVGDSSGGNIAHYLAVRFGLSSPWLAPVRVRGSVLIAPFFGGVVRTKSEEGPCEKLMGLEALDRFWRLSLPAGENRDHPLANPFGPGSLSIEGKDLDPMLVIVGGNELLKDRVEDYAKRLKDMGKKVDYVEFEGKEHGFFTYYPYSQDSNKIVQLIKHFMLQNIK